LINKTGLFQTFFILAIAAAILVFLFSFLIRLPDASSQAQVRKTAAGHEYTPLQMAGTPLFWLSFVWNTIICSAGLMVINSAAGIAATFGAPAVLGLMVSVSNGAGRFIFGGLVDRFGRRRVINTISTIMLISGICLYTGAVFQNIAFIIGGLLLMGMSYGSSPSVSSVNINSFFGPRNYPVNFSLHNFLLIPSAIAGPTISGIMLNKSNGMYNSNFILIIVLALVSFAFGGLLNRTAQIHQGK